jgi:hypothetical protein
LAGCNKAIPSKEETCEWLAEGIPIKETNMENVSDFVADCRRIEEWGKEQFAATAKFLAGRPGQKAGVDFAWEDLPFVAIDLPSRRRELDRQAAQDEMSEGSPLMPQA